MSTNVLMVVTGMMMWVPGVVVCIFGLASEGVQDVWYCR